MSGNTGSENPPSARIHTGLPNQRWRDKLVSLGEEAHMLIGIGVAFIVLGFLFCLTIIGAFIGIPMILLGVVLCVAGAFRRKTIIQNVVTVQNSSYPAQAYGPQAGQAYAPALPEPSIIPQIETGSPSRSPSRIV